MSSRYLLEDIAYRSLEQACSTLIKAATRVSKESELGHIRDESWVKAMDEISTISLNKYQSLVLQGPRFPYLF